MAKIEEARTRDEIMACWPVINELRPHVSEAEVVAKVQLQMTEQTYRLMYIREGSTVVAFLGFRILNFLWSGKTLYIDDLCTLSTAHRRGNAGTLLDWAIAHAKTEKCDAVSLDSGYTRNNAHRLYLNKGFDLASHHFHISLNK
jgi:GNAT superfamily N-acetyltransferase